MKKINLFEKVLNECLTTGADFAEIFAEDTKKNVIQLSDSKIKQCNTENLYGAGIRILKGIEEVYGYTNDVTEKGLMQLATNLKANFKGRPSTNLSKLKKSQVREVTNEDLILTDVVENDKKVNYMVQMNKAALAVDTSIKQVFVNYFDNTQKVTIANTLGKFVEGVRYNSRFTITVMAKNKTRVESISDNYGGSFHFNDYDLKKLKKMASDTAKSAIELLSSEEVVGGIYDVIIHNGFGGVIFHEACGHSLEATAVADNLSVFSNKIGEVIASECVTAIDDGTITNEWGSLAFDDEGYETTKNVLIENGVLKSYLVDYRNARKMKTNITSSARRESYRYAPTSRMTNTYIQNGNISYEKIIKQTESGIFAEKMGGGSVNPVTGDFNFSIAKGYMIEDGKLTKVIKGATLIGTGAKTLLDIDLVANNQTFGYGFCGSSSGSVYAAVGQPTIRVKNMTVGGNGVKK